MTTYYTTDTKVYFRAYDMADYTSYTLELVQDANQTEYTVNLTIDEDFRPNIMYFNADLSALMVGRYEYVLKGDSTQIDSGFIYIEKTSPTNEYLSSEDETTRYI